jgi:hypothetical protein
LKDEDAMARKLKLKIPKKVAGVKIPKSVRKGPVRDFLNSSAGQLLLAEGLIVLSGARQPMESLGKVKQDASGPLSQESARLSFAFKEAIRAFRAAMDDNGEISVEADRKRKDKKAAADTPPTPH